VNDTSLTVGRLVADHNRALTAEQRWQIAASQFETARAIVDSSLPAGLTAAQRRVAVARRLYGSELPELALIAHGTHGEPRP
jgi:hypothetical protein